MNLRTSLDTRTITQFLVFTTAMMVACCAGIYPVWAKPYSATDKFPKPADPSYVAPRIAFDCNILDTRELAPGLVDTLIGDTTDGPTLAPGYNCTPYPAGGPENTYRLDVITELELWAGLREIGEVDLDLYLLNACDTDSCLIGANTEFSIVLEPGTYYLVVEGAGSGSTTAGPYKVALDTRWPGLPPEICEPATTEPVTCGAELISMPGDLFGKPNHIQTYDCSPIVERGGEAWFEITLEPFHEFSASTILLHPQLDPALWLFEDCVPGSQCLAFSDELTSGQHETIAWVNDTETPMTLYLALDSYRPAAFEGAGQYELQFTCQSNVPTTTSSWGSVRAKFRGLKK
jgi:hypothetical protein